MGDPSEMRVADADRERVVEELREHTIAGRLTSEELEERSGSAYRARTRAELDVLRADLPVSATSVKLALFKRKAQLRRRLAQEAGGGLGVSALSVGIWLLTGGHHHSDFWPAWVIGATMQPLNSRQSKHDCSAVTNAVSHAGIASTIGACRGESVTARKRRRAPGGRIDE
jgi:hypothetical protein